MKTVQFFLSALFIMTMSACGPNLVPFTQDLVDENQWSEDEIKKIQFYVSRDIVLYREVSKSNSEIISGKIKMESGKKVEEVIIKRGTPGIMLFKPKEKSLAISFDDGSDQRFLMFGPNPKAGDRYVLKASEWTRKRGKITYEGKSFYTNSESAFASLMVDLKKLRKVSVRSSRAKGRKL